MVWARIQSQWKGKNYRLSFPEEVEKSYFYSHNVFSDVIFYPRVLQYIVLGIKNYPSACVTYCSDDLALLLPNLARSLESGIRDYICPRINFCLYSTLAENWAGQH